jgi:Ala-tRNA(Pro) deacylase
MPTKRLKKFLEENSVRFETLPHSTAYTAQEVAASVHVHGRELAKSTVVKVDGRFVLAVLPAPMHVDVDAFRRATGGRDVILAAEEDLARLFPDCELGAMSPFGNLYDLEVWVDETLASDPSIVFNAGTHTEAIRIGFADFERLVKPRRALFASK